jgi:DNA-binding transcriptional MerR regulator
MAYTVKKLAAMSAVSVRALHFYDEVGLLKPAYLGGNGYRIYEEPQLLMLQQILFYRELGFELKQIKKILSGPGFDKIAALESHRKVLQKNLAETRKLIVTIDKTGLAQGVRGATSAASRIHGGGDDALRGKGADLNRCGPHYLRRHHCNRTSSLV